VTFEGKVVADPDLRFAANGTAVCKIRTVTNSRKFDKETNEWRDDKTCWLDVTCFKQLAENVAESITKGDSVVVVGKLQTDEWEDKETGQKRSKTEVIADAVGPALTWRAAGHSGRSERTSSTPTDDPWAGGQDSAPPF
jgi:single-strand DNA-binding protein